MRILFFGRLADRFGRELELDAADGYTVADLRVRLALNDSGSRACVGESLVDDDFILGSALEVEFWPPVSGG